MIQFFRLKLINLCLRLRVCARDKTSGTLPSASYHHGKKEEGKKKKGKKERRKEGFRTFC